MNEGSKIGYCTNVHAGVTIEQVKANLQKHAIPVKRLFRPDSAMGIGLWLSNQAANELLSSGGVQDFAQWLREAGLDPFTFNAFPFSDFHQSTVKHNVYLPTWAEESRLQYTVNIAKIQASILDEGEFGSVSTLPLGWPVNASKEFFHSSAKHLLSCADQLAEIKEQNGRHISLCIEPEPGCAFDISQHVIEFFDHYLEPIAQTQNALDRVRQHVGVCHDVCHAAVMNELQTDAIKNYRAHEIQIGKFQISSAIEARFDGKSQEQKRELISELRSFAEDRYLHQTTIVDGKSRWFRKDLPLALDEFGDNPNGVWTIHFHVPIFAKQLGLLGTTQPQIESVLQELQKEQALPLHFEIETYAWTVLPESLRPNSLSDAIVQELQYFQQLLHQI